MKRKRFLVGWSLGILVALPTWADQIEPEGAYLDAPYEKVNPLVIDIDPTSASLTGRSNTSALIAKQTSVKSQGARGTCSIFSATALIESILKIQGVAAPALDFSEEWLEYLAVRNSYSDGSSSTHNFQLMGSYGMPEEELLPYVGETWETKESSRMAGERCGRVPERYKKGCLLAHRDPRYLEMTDLQLRTVDPEFVSARRRAAEIKGRYFRNLVQDFYVRNVSEARSLLDRGIPITLDIDFYYGAWNHRKADEYGIGRDSDQWSKGIVGYPERGSVDEQQSRANPAGHSVVLVGYDDSIVVTSNVKMKDGTIKRFTHRGVYYFKNSWGTGSFGTGTKIDGKVYPGYGMITQDYAHQYGELYKLPWR